MGLPTEGGRVSAIAFKSAAFHIRSRNGKDFAVRYPQVLKGLAKLPNETAIDGELVAFGKDGGRPSTRCRITGPQPHRSRSTSSICSSSPAGICAVNLSTSASRCSSARSCPSVVSPCATSVTWTPPCPT